MAAAQMRFAGVTASWLVATALSLSACDSASEPADTDGASGSGESGLAPCEAQPTVTYDTFGRGFLSTYCDGCHGSQVIARQGAPADVIFDTPDGAQMWGDRILARVVPDDGGPATMPPAGGVTPDDRTRVQVWLTCFE